MIDPSLPLPGDDGYDFEWPNELDHNVVYYTVEESSMQAQTRTQPSAPPKEQIPFDGPSNESGATTTPLSSLQSTIPIVPRSGWSTSEAHFTAAFVALAAVLSFAGYKTTPDHLQNLYDSVTHLLDTVGPLLAAIPVVWNYITSRGKLKSNTVNAAAIVAASAGPPALALPGAQGLFGLSGKLGKLVNVGAAIADSGILPGKAGQIAGDVTSVLGGGTPANETGPIRMLTDQQIIAGFEGINGRLDVVESRLTTVDARVSVLRSYIDSGRTTPPPVGPPSADSAPLTNAPPSSGSRG